MVYLDYSATMPPLLEVRQNFGKLLEEYIGNPNSFHQLGIKNQELITAATKQIAQILNIKDKEIIYTSGATESNNHVLKVICDQYKNRGNKILTTSLEHPSILTTLDFLVKKGFQVEYVALKVDGTVNLDDLERKLTSDVILITIGSVNSETGIRQPVEKIGKKVKEHKCFFHSDITQSVGKEKVNLTHIDFASFSAHKFGGLKGIGVLYKKEKIALEPFIHGGASINLNRAGTPPLELIVAMATALRLSYQNWQEKYDYVQKLQKILWQSLLDLDLPVNANEKCIPHIVNFSVLSLKSAVVQQILANEEIYISTQTACTRNKEVSQAVKVLSGDEQRARHSLRVSLSYLTTEEELKIFKEKIKKIIKSKGEIL